MVAAIDPLDRQIRFQPIPPLIFIGVPGERGADTRVIGQTIIHTDLAPR